MPSANDLVRLKVVSSEMEAEMLRGLLEDEGIHSMYRPTDVAAASFDGWSPGGAREVLVAVADLERARQLVPQK